MPSVKPTANGSANRDNKMDKVVRAGIIGLGEIGQLNHIPCLGYLSDYFQITYLCDASCQALEYCAAKVSGPAPRTTSSPAELCSSPDVDVVLLCNATAYHPSHAILALQQDKYVFIEKPVALCVRDMDAILDAEKRSKGRVFVGYQRRYAEAFLDAVQEVGGMDKIIYARVRDIIGMNSSFIEQSGTYPKKFTDFKEEDTADMMEKDEEMVTQSLVTELGLDATPEMKRMLRLLGGLGTHDLSTMRGMLGFPQAVLGVYLGFPIWNVLFQYDGFAVSYESGINNVPTFDAHIEVYSNDKIVRVQYDTPYVKGLPVIMTVRERIPSTRGDGYQERIVRKTYEDPYTLEFLELWKCVSQGLEPKTSALDASEDVKLFGMILQASPKSKSGK